MMSFPPARPQAELWSMETVNPSNSDCQSNNWLTNQDHIVWSHELGHCKHQADLSVKWSIYYGSLFKMGIMDRINM